MGIWGEHNSTNDRVPAPASNPHLLAGPRHLAPSQGTLITLTGCLRERTPSHLAAGRGVGAGLTCPVNARTRLFFLGEDKKNACLFLDAEPERGLLSGRFQCPLWHGQKNSTNSPRPPKAKPPSGSARRPPPLCACGAPKVLRGASAEPDSGQQGRSRTQNVSFVSREQEGCGQK